MTKKITREQWLEQAVKLIADKILEPAGYTVPEKVRVSFGFPVGNWRKVIGQCFYPECAPDGSTHVYVSPTLDVPARILDVLLHELGHACIGPGHGHKGPFKAFCRKVGLGGKPSATVVEPGSPLEAQVGLVLQELPELDHAPVTPGKDGGTKERTRKAAVRLYSTNDETYVVRIKTELLEAHGLPSDPWGDTMVPKDALEEEGGGE